jgi:hypothetical protein
MNKIMIYGIKEVEFRCFLPKTLNNFLIFNYLLLINFYLSINKPKKRTNI